MACEVGDVVTLLEELAPPRLAEDWDNAGLQVGSRRAQVEAVLISLDVTPEVLGEARERGAGLLACHHPPIFRPLRSLVTDEPRAALLRDALAAGMAIYAAHTSLDASPRGVNDALGALFELEDQRPLLEAHPREEYKLVTFVPPEHVVAVSAALFGAGAGVIGDYSGCSFRVEGTGTFTPGPGTRPAYGDPSGPSEVREARLEVVLPAESMREAVEALLASHPYEEPAYDLHRVHVPQGAGLGRVGDLPAPVSLGELARRCRGLLGNPAARLCGDPTAAVRRVAVCGGSGGDMAGAALAAGAQVLITGDVGHHQALDALAVGLAIIDAGHYHTERPVLSHLASLLEGKARKSGLALAIHVSETDTCPWIDGGGG
ncbi:MAG: Nif3-like dinuclear metal center hexameric protein [Actinomycetota bacterium]|nr:Nif3-like dinuclear metal center hexameric protein [Actinomycetota bacterium]MDD5667124.1 Nif3-like dinuclear metal center hexameric protein [Actinomycetota bacterium]